MAARVAPFGAKKKPGRMRSIARAKARSPKGQAPGAPRMEQSGAHEDKSVFFLFAEQKLGDFGVVREQDGRDT